MRRLTPISLPLLIVALLGGSPAEVDAHPATKPVVAPATALPTLGQETREGAISRGRVALAHGQLDEARSAFEQAAELDPAGTEARFWLMRLEIAEGRQEEVLGKLSRQRREGQAGPDQDYLLAMALEALANAQVQRGAGSAGLSLEDAYSALAPISATGLERYGDAHLALARVARQLGRHAECEAAARRALEAEPSSAEAAGLLGRALLGQLAALPPDKDAQREALYNGARQAFERGIAALGSSLGQPAEQALAADLWNQLGTTHAFGKAPEAAAKAYTQAIALDPAIVDFGAIRSALGDAAFATSLEMGSEAFVKRFGTNDARDATTQWWLGFAQFSMNEPARRPAARAAFESAIQKYPGYINSLYYLARLCYDDQDYPKAIEHLSEYWRLAPEGLASIVGADDVDLSRIEFLIGRAMSGANFPQAILLSRLLCQARPQTSRFWNNLGLFLRDDGDQRIQRLKPEDTAERAAILEQWEESLSAYERALAIEPENPAYLNDTAVILHYNLKRDYPRALELYQQAFEEAEKLLAKGGLDPETKVVVETARRDSKNNRGMLEKQLERAKKPAKEDPQPPAGG